MKFTIDYDLSVEDDKIDHFYAMNGRRYANFICEIQDNLRSAEKYDSFSAIGINTEGLTEEKLSLVSKTVFEIREYFYELKNSMGIKDYDD